MSSKVNKVHEKNKKHSETNWLQVGLNVICTGILIAAFVTLIYYSTKYFGFISWEELDSRGDIQIELADEEYCYSIDEYYYLRYARASKQIENLHSCGLLPDKEYKYMKEGIDSQFFYNSCIIDYADYQKEADKFMTICNKLSGDAYECDEIDKCTDDCVFCEYMETYINENSREQLAEVHENYHKAIASKQQEYKADDSLFEYYYELELVSNLDNIESLKVKVNYLSAKNLRMPDAMLNWYIYSKLATPFRHSEYFDLSDREALEYLSLINDATMFDEAVADKAMNILYVLGDELENRTDDTVTIIDITGIENYSEYIDSKLEAQKGITNIKNTKRFYTFSITDRLEGEQVFAVFNVEECKHKDNLPTFEEYATDEWKNNVVHKLVVDSFWSEMFMVE